jgi:hypothetical protein
MIRLTCLFFIVFVMFLASGVCAEQRNDPREQALSDTLDLWREGRFEQVYDCLSHRNGMSRERFAMFLRDAAGHPACCHQKLNNFRVISEKRTTAKVYAKLGMEGSPGTDSSQSREFTMDHEEGQWKMRMSDIKALAGLTRKKKK